jgi:hypothetical protein
LIRNNFVFRKLEVGLDAAMMRWSNSLGTEASRKELSSQITDSTNGLKDALGNLEKLRKSYLKYPEIDKGLAQPKLDDLYKASGDFSNAIKSADPSSPSDLDNLRRLAGTIRFQMSYFTTWMQSVQKTANAYRKSLSEAH